jgi:hypothetical protein
MATVTKRIEKLEDRLGLADGRPSLLMVVTCASGALALDENRCIEILGECGHLPTVRRLAVCKRSPRNERSRCE